jgi:glyceraldehyde-3-phosphate dehydrogenase (NADP+)
MPQMSQYQALEILDYAKDAWDGGAGVWPQKTLRERVEAIEKFCQELKSQRDDIINVLMWEIGKNLNDATAEFDRTMTFIEQVIVAIRSDPEFNSTWQSIGSVKAFVRRAAVGVIMCLGPYNYPLNETYATLIPALLMGNIVVMKIPTVGGLVHLLTMEAFAKALPPGTIHFISGSGRTTMPPLMQSGDIDGLAFIGGSKAADGLIKQHPSPHRLKLFLQLEAKNMGVSWTVVMLIMFET